jgi:ATP citrate (pro-S)-lyase
MARKKVREFAGKRLLKAAMQRLHGVDLPIRVAQVKGATDLAALVAANPWLATERLVVKPDCLFGQRGKNDLVGLNLTWSEAEAFIRARMGREVTVKAGVSGPVDCFVVEPFVPHDDEYYLCVQSHRLDTEVSFCPAGGVDIEENWDKLRSVRLAAGTEASPPEGAFAPLVAGLAPERRDAVERFVRQCVAVFDDLDCTMLEMNPFTLDPKTGAPFPLDIRVELDDTAAFRSASKWASGAADDAAALAAANNNTPTVEFPLPFGRVLTAAEARIANLDEGTGASLKFTVLNPKGRIWLMVAGGGASVIFSDTVGDLGFAGELGNYGEYSGAPSEQETYSYACTVLDVATAGADGRGRALLIGGGIANFTDVAATFRGIIAALRERKDALRQSKMRVYVRRGGPNYQAGLDAMRKVGEELGVEVAVHGPEASMTGICAEAIQYVKSFD